MLRQRQRAAHRHQDWRTPPLRGERHSAGVPPQDPGVQQGVAEVVGDARREVGRHRPGPENREEEKSTECKQVGRCGPAVEG